MEISRGSLIMPTAVRPSALSPLLAGSAVHGAVALGFPKRASLFATPGACTAGGAPGHPLRIRYCTAFGRFRADGEGDVRRATASRPGQSMRYYFADPTSRRPRALSAATTPDGRPLEGGPVSRPHARHCPPFCFSAGPQLFIPETKCGQAPRPTWALWVCRCRAPC
jgi:hypothetical protein